MKILVFLHGTLIMHKNGVSKTRGERVRQSAQREASVLDYGSYVPIGRAVEKLNKWINQGVEILYLSSHEAEDDVNKDKEVLEKYNFPKGIVLWRQNGESYAWIAERLIPDILIEDDCESIGGEPEMTYTHINPELKPRIKHITVKEFEGIDRLPDGIKELKNTGKYVFKPYNPIFPDLFDKEKERLKSYPSGNYQIEHIGSTAVPGLGGKGIIDIMIAVPKEQMKDSSAQLEKAGYEYIEQAGIEQRWFHWQDLPDPIETFRRYHIHLTYPESEEWKKAIAFRDYLRNNPQDAAKYAEAKRTAVKDNKNTKESYMASKESTIQEILQKALPHLYNTNVLPPSG